MSPSLPTRPVPLDSGVAGPEEDAACASHARVSYFARQSKTMFSSLVAIADDQTYSIIDLTEEACLKVLDQKDFDGNGTKDALVKLITACGGNCCGNSFFFVSYAGNGQFQRSEAFGYAWTDPTIGLWNGRWSVKVVSSNEGVNQAEPKERTERFVFDLGKAVLVEASERKSIVADVELKSAAFDMGHPDERHGITIDLDNDGAADKITGELWQRWGRILWIVQFANGKSYASQTSCKRIGVLKSRTAGVRDLVCDEDRILRWTGQAYE